MGIARSGMLISKEYVSLVRLIVSDQYTLHVVGVFNLVLNIVEYTP